MQTVIQFVTEHWVMISFAAAYVFIALVETMPAPGDTRPVSQKAYQWAYDAFHIIANKVIERKPGLSVPSTQAANPPKENQ